MNKHKYRIGLKAISIFTMVVLNTLVVFCFVVQAGNPHAATYSSDNDKLFWFLQISDIHIGTRGSQDSQNLQWIVNEAKNIINPSFIIVSGDLTDSTNGNIFGYPNGPYQEEWDEYKGILSAAGMDSNFYYDIPGNHDAYSDQYFAFYIANSIQGQATGKTQISWTRTFSFGKYHFLGINSSDNSGDPFSLSWPWGDYAGLDPSELSFIHSELQQNQDADLTLIFGHHPVTDTGYSDDTWLFYGQTEFVGFMDSYGASLYGYGHTHRFEEEIFAGNDYTGYMAGDGVYYFNIASIGKSNENQFSIIAVDCNGISLVTENVNHWPAVLITTPLDKYVGTFVNPYAYSVPNSNTNPIRTLVFDTNSITGVQYRIDGTGNWLAMNSVSGNPYLWETSWDASSLSQGEHYIEVQATSVSGTGTDIITVNIEGSSICNNNGICEVGEDCNNCLNDCIIGGGEGICGNGVCEPTIGEDCLSCPNDCAGKQGGKPSKRFCCGDGEGENPADCTDPRCTSGEFECGGPSQSYCCGDNICEGAEDSYNCALDCGAPPFCGDGTCDVNEDQCSCSQDCGTPPSSETSCTDGVDNDCDGPIDCEDLDCNGDPVCTITCGVKGDQCTNDSECCSGRCHVKKRTCL